MTELDNIFSAADLAYKEFGPLIAYLEEAMMKPGVALNKPVKWLTSDFNKLKSLQQEVKALNDGQIKLLYS
jgi:hypothetical protein